MKREGREGGGGEPQASVHVSRGYLSGVGGELAMSDGCRVAGVHLLADGEEGGVAVLIGKRSDRPLINHPCSRSHD